LTYYNTLKASEQNNLYVDIISDVERYRDLLNVMKEANDMAFYNKNKATFNSYVKMYERFGRKIEK